MKQLKQVMEELADFEPTHFPFISLYLNTQPDQHGRANFDSFVRKEFRARGKTYTSRSTERESFDRDTQRAPDGSVSALCGAGCRYQFGSIIHLRTGNRPEQRYGQQSKSEPNFGGRLVADALPAAHRQLSPQSRKRDS